MPKPTLPAWLNQTTHLADFELDITFMLQEEFYSGGDNNVAQLAQPERYREPLYQPASAQEQPVTARRMASHPDELIRHYQQVVALAEKYQKTAGDEYFWLRPKLRHPATHEVLLALPWYDTLAEARQLLAWVQTTPPGNVFFDVEQGWELEVWHLDGLLFIREGDPDTEENHGLLHLDRTQFIGQLTTALAAAEVLVQLVAPAISPKYHFRGL